MIRVIRAGSMIAPLRLESYEKVIRFVSAARLVMVVLQLLVLIISRMFFKRVRVMLDALNN